MAATQIFEFDDGAEHSFDALLLELANDRGRQKSQVLASEILFANFDEDGELTSKRGAKEISFSGVNNTGEVAGGVLNFPNFDRSQAHYLALNDIVDDFTLRTKVRMNAATVSADTDIVVLDSNVDNSRIRFYLQNQGAGITRIWREITDSAGVVVSNVLLTTRNFSTSPNFEVGFVNDDDGNTLSYVDGVLYSTVASPSFDFTDCDLIFGSNAAGAAVTPADYDDVQLWNTVVALAMAGQSPESTTYDLNEAMMETLLPFLIDKLVGITIVQNVPAGASLGHLVCLNNEPYWHDGAAWVVSNGTLAESNSAAELLANFSTLPIIPGFGVGFKLCHIFKSDSGYATAEIEQITLTFDLQFKSGELVKCVVKGTVVDNAGNPVPGAIVRVDSDDKFKDDSVIGPSAKVVANSQGKFSIGIPETETTGKSVNFTMEYPDVQVDEDGEEEAIYLKVPYDKRIIPNKPSEDFTLLAIAP